MPGEQAMGNVLANSDGAHFVFLERACARSTSQLSRNHAVSYGERTRPACCARRPAEHRERLTNSLSSGLSARVDSFGETPTDAAETAALPISTTTFRLSLGRNGGDGFEPTKSSAPPNIPVIPMAGSDATTC